MRRLTVVALTVWLTGCGGASGSETTGQVAPSPSPTIAESGLRPSESFAIAEITLTDGDEQIQMPVFLANTPALQRHGLMERAHLPDNAGMLFAFDEPTRRGFWMKNTLIPLSIAFLDADGTVIELADMVPCDTDPCPTYRPGAQYRYALEANRGFFDQRGITTGWRLHFSGLPRSEASLKALHGI